MATQAVHLSVHPPLEFRKKRLSEEHNKDELEREVAVLHKMLDYEQRVHDYLEHLHRQPDHSALTIPNFLPLKMKETLAELSMVESEITRLESQIKHLQAQVKHEKEANIETKYKRWGWGRQTLQTLRESSPLLPEQDTIDSKRTKETTVAFDTKAMHFINKAIKGDYNLSKSFNASEKPVHSAGYSSQKENRFHDQGGGIYREKLSRKSGMVKAPSPMRESRHQPTPRRDRNLDTSSDMAHKAASNPLNTEEENIHRWTPNKLSENIMKCLIFIFIRLLRTSRVMELEKTGPVARSTSFALSFRAEASSASKTSLMFQKDSRQQDPFGVFDMEESIPRDIGPYKNLVRLTSSSMDMKFIQNSSSVPLLQKLKVLIDGLKKVDLRFLSHHQKLAFWINMYNACIMHGYLQYGVPSVFSPENLLALINKASLNIAGNVINAQAIEHFILRKPQDSPPEKVLGKHNDKEMMVRELHGLDNPDPNVTFALCCGTRSSPAVRIYTAEGVTGELERSKQEYLQAAVVVTSSKRIALPELLLRNMNNFASETEMEAVMEWVCQQLPTSGTLRKSIVECFRGHNSQIGKSTTSAASVDKIPYEFEFQYLLAM